jgi:hypothetical protein
MVSEHRTSINCIRKSLLYLTRSHSFLGSAKPSKAVVVVACDTKRLRVYVYMYMCSSEQKRALEQRRMQSLPNTVCNDKGTAGCAPLSASQPGRWFGFVQHDQARSLPHLFGFDAKPSSCAKLLEGVGSTQACCTYTQRVSDVHFP